MQKRESFLKQERSEYTCAELTTCVMKRDFLGYRTTRPSQLPRAHGEQEPHRQCQQETENSQSHPGKEDRECEYRGEAVLLGSTGSLYI